MTIYEAKILVDEINKTKYRKTAWEEAFIAKVKDLVKAGVKLSSAQSLSLQGIYRKASA
jgi:hypothetical protein